MMAQFYELIGINLNLSEDLVKKYFEGKLQLWHILIGEIKKKFQIYL